MYKNIIIVKFQTLYIRKTSQLNKNIVIVYEIEPPGHREGQKYPLSSPKFPFILKKGSIHELLANPFTSL